MSSSVKVPAAMEGGAVVSKSQSHPAVSRVTSPTAALISEGSDGLSTNITTTTTADYEEDLENLRQLLRLHNIAGDRCDVRHIRCTAGSSSGDNYMSVVKRIQIGGTPISNDATTSTETELKDVPVLSLIVKRQIPSLSRRQLFRCDEAFKNEISAYKQIVPLLKYYAPELCLPKCHFAGRDSFGEIIILEDLKAAGFRMQNRLQGLDIDYCELVMKQLASLHAASIVAKHLNAEVFRDKCSQIHDVVYGTESEDFYKNILESSIQESLLSLRTSNSDGSLTEPIRLIEILQADLFHTLQRRITQAKDGLCVLCHGDLWVNNIMFKSLTRKRITKTNSNECHSNSIVSSINNIEEENDDIENSINDPPSDVRFFDLQAMRYTSPVFDILHFIYTSTKRDLRDAYIPTLLKTYSVALDYSLRRQFSQAIMTTKTSTSSISAVTLNNLCQTFSLSNITAEYYEHILYGLAISMWILPAVTFDPDFIPNLDEISEQNPSVKELKCTQMLTPEYHTRLRDLVLEFYQHGYLNERESTSSPR